MEITKLWLSIDAPLLLHQDSHENNEGSSHGLMKSLERKISGNVHFIRWTLRGSVEYTALGNGQ